MNYQHRYHAGNFADVIKHAIMIALLQRLQQKNKPMVILDVFAGAGLYDLNSPEAQKSQEYQHGISRLLNTPVLSIPALQKLKQCVLDLNSNDEKLFYPGSPWILSQLLKPRDRLILVEKHPLVYQQLKAHFYRHAHIAIHHRDAYEALKALLPPEPRRGFVLMDPPYEDKNEFEHLTGALQHALSRWENGIFLLWYPIKTTSNLTAFYRKVSRLSCDEIMNATLRVLPNSAPGLIGCGFILLNSPYQFDTEFKSILQMLAKILDPCEKASFQCQWLKAARD
ncbi:MAG: hypothetical protein A3F17_01015 [Gammaproteobacteria bacterium RIFCSPHIGHO2_12_FULL_41_15]|nr:MAG: hypothetical protein A3F17_01015 [Gammaproteobacteria bacterium RIFCSPHIGHO2_12_FULL_41_15]